MVRREIDIGYFCKCVASNSTDMKFEVATLLSPKLRHDTLLQDIGRNNERTSGAVHYEDDEGTAETFAIRASLPC